MIYVILIPLVLAAVFCFGFNRVLTTQALGLFAALVALVVIGLVGASESLTAIPATVTFALGPLEPILIAPPLPPERALVFTLLGSGTVALLALALVIAPTVRSFGTIFAWLLLTLAAGTLALLVPATSLLMPFVWALVVLLSYAALRSSSALNRNDLFPHGVTMGLAASLLLLAGLLAIAPAVAVDALPSPAAAVCVLIAVLIFVGGVPFHTVFREASAAPAMLGVVLYGVVYPLVGASTLLRLLNALPIVPYSWSIVLVASGVLSVVVCSAAALRTHHLGVILGWQASAQAGAVLVASGLSGPLPAIAAPALLVNLVLSTVVGALAVANAERTSGTDDYTYTGASLRISGLLWACAAAAALGLPPFWGFWGRMWLLQSALLQVPWAVPLLLVGGVLLVLAFVVPLARFWRVSAQPQPQVSGINPGLQLLALLPLLVLGAAPQLAWVYWLRGVTFAPSATPIALTTQVLMLVVGSVGVLWALLIMYGFSARTILVDPDVEPVLLGVDTFGSQLFPLGWLGQSDGAAQLVWAGMKRVSDGIQAVLALFEQRYYLLGVLLALVSIMLLMAQ